MSDVRARLLYAFTTGLLVVAGLTVYLRGDALSVRTRDWLGDALWAAMITSLIGVVMPRQRVVVRGAVALVICYAVEFSQRLHAPALDRVRATRIGHLVLGSDYDARDLVAYTAGVVAFSLLAYGVTAAVAARRVERARRR